MRDHRTSDLVIMLAHTLQCEKCRQRLLDDPARLSIGRKLTAEQRERLMALEPEHFETSATLARATGLNASDLIEGMDHPRARLRHL